MQVTPLGPVLGAAIGGIDLSAPPDAATLAALREAFLRYQVISVRDQHLTARQLLEFCRLFGTVRPNRVRPQNYHPDQPEIYVLSNSDVDVFGRNQRIAQGDYWHTDQSYNEYPAIATCLYSVETPRDGGDTRFIDMYGAYERLPAALRARLDGRRAEHVLIVNEPVFGIPGAPASTNPPATEPVQHPVVRVHPETGRKALYVNPGTTVRIVDMPRAESDALLAEVFAHVIVPALEYRHRWTRNEVVMWDNRCLVHAATNEVPEGQRRVMYRALIEAAAPAA